MPTDTPTATGTPTETPTAVPSVTPTAIPVDLQGCGPGYWKQEHHFDSRAGFTSEDDYETVFGIDASFGSSTLVDAAWLGGGGEMALARQAAMSTIGPKDADAVRLL